jgi:hypothetical protein
VFLGQAQGSKTGKPREYTDEQRKAIPARLLAGQEEAKKKRDIEPQFFPVQRRSG